MKFLKFLLSLAITLSLIYVLDNRWVVKNIPIPPLGKFLDPFHGFWQNIETSDAFESAEFSIEGLKEPVSVVYDSLLIPHIFAANDGDLYLVQGYLHAKYRLWQMDFQTRAAAGRLSEIIGTGPNDVVLNRDRSQRRQGMVSAAQALLEYLEEDQLGREIYEKYTEGVNRYVNSLTYKDYPLEFKLLDYSPEEWTTLKSALMLKSMAQTLNSGDKDLEMTNALNLFGPDVVELLFPDHEPVGDPIVDRPGQWNFEPTTIPDSISRAVPKDLINLPRINEPDPTTGSNNWAVSGSKTVTGSPILCSDPHLTITLPSLWYVLQLNAPGINCMGATLAGLPQVIIGYNDSIAWGLTNGQRDLVDWYRIQFDDESMDEYMLDGRPIPSKKVIEEIKIRDREPFYDTVVYTTWGPVMFDKSFHGEHELAHFAYRWISHDPSDEMTAFHKLNRAKNFSDYMEALNYLGAPAQNIVFASTAGDIAIRVQGKFPVRRKFEGKFVIDGSTSQHGWQAYIPNEQNAVWKNPVRGFVSSANQYPVDNTYPYYITSTSYEAYRNRRINQVLAADSVITVDDMMKLQNDNFNLKAYESLPMFLDSLDSVSLNVDEQYAFRALRSWDYMNDVNSEGAVYYEAWWDRLMPTIWDEMRGTDFRLRYPTTWNTIHLIKTQHDLSFFDIIDTPEKETAKEVLRKSFSEGVNDVLEWKAKSQTDTTRWADFKDTYIEHLALIRQFSYHVQHGGNHDIVNASTRRHGPSWRMIVSLEKGNVQPYATYPGGQSGNPGSRYYNNLLDHWSTGTYFKLWFMNSQGDARQKSYFSTQLSPSK